MRQSNPIVLTTSDNRQTKKRKSRNFFSPYLFAAYALLLETLSVDIGQIVIGVGFPLVRLELGNPIVANGRRSSRGCTGISIRSGAYYYCKLHPDILLKMDDLDKLTLKEYDDLCGVKRKYISTRKMAYIRQRAKDRQREKTAK